MPSGVRGLQRRQRSRYKAFDAKSAIVYPADIYRGFHISKMLIYYFTLMKSSPILEFIKSKKGWEQRQGTKKEWTPELAEKAAALFEEASTKHALVIGDAPGKITDESKTITEKAHYAIILCRIDSKNQIKDWQSFFKGLRIPVICVAVSKLTGKGNVEKKSCIKATLIGLDRTPKTDEVMVNLALLIKEKLGF
jgi:hypothetical protein